VRRDAAWNRRAVRADQIDARQFGLFAAILCKGRHLERVAGADQLAAVTLVKPFRLLADLAFAGLAALDAFQEHAHRVGLVRGCDRVAVHLVAPLGRAEMGQAGAGHDAMRGVGVVDRRDKMPRRQFGREIDAVALTTGQRGVEQRPAFGDRALGQRDDALDARHERGLVAARQNDRTLTRGRAVLQQTISHEILP